MGPGAGGKRTVGEAERQKSDWKDVVSWVRESEFCFVTIIAIVDILILDVMRKLLGSQWQGRVWRCALTLTFIRMKDQDDWSQGHLCALSLSAQPLAPQVTAESPLPPAFFSASPRMPFSGSALLYHWQ